MRLDVWCALELKSAIGTHLNRFKANAQHLWMECYDVFFWFTIHNTEAPSSLLLILLLLLCGEWGGCTYTPKALKWWRKKIMKRRTDCLKCFESWSDIDSEIISPQSYQRTGASSKMKRFSFASNEIIYCKNERSSTAKRKHSLVCLFVETRRFVHFICAMQPFHVFEWMFLLLLFL